MLRLCSEDTSVPIDEASDDVLHERHNLSELGDSSWLWTELHYTAIVCASLYVCIAIACWWCISVHPRRSIWFIACSFHRQQCQQCQAVEKLASNWVYKTRIIVFIHSTLFLLQEVRMTSFVCRSVGWCIFCLPQLNNGFILKTLIQWALLTCHCYSWASTLQ